MIGRAIIAALALLAAIPAPSDAQPGCGDRKAIIARLEAKYGETRQAGGLSADGKSVMLLYGAASTGTWTLIQVLPSGFTCIIAFGTTFQRDEPSKPTGPAL